MTNEFTQRYFQGWKSCVCSTNGKLQPFSQAEVEHICMINEHLKHLTEEVVMKALRVSRLFLSELDHGNNDYEDYEITANISMTYDEDDDNYDDGLKRLIDYTWTQPDFEPIHLSSDTCEYEQAHFVDATLLVCNHEQSGIGHFWNEMWDVHLVSLSWAFGHFFNHLRIFTMEDIMKIQPCNFITELKISL